MPGLTVTAALDIAGRFSSRAYVVAHDVNPNDGTQRAALAVLEAAGVRVHVQIGTSGDVPSLAPVIDAVEVAGRVACFVRAVGGTGRYVAAGDPVEGAYLTVYAPVRGGEE